MPDRKFIVITINISFEVEAMMDRHQPFKLIWSGFDSHRPHQFGYCMELPPSDPGKSPTYLWPYNFVRPDI